MLQQDSTLLRPLQDGDRSSLASLANNVKIWENVRDYFPFPYSEQDAEAFITFTKQELSPMTLAIVWQGHFCGVIGLVAQTDVYRKTAEIGYWLGEPFWGKGIATAAVRLMTDYGLYHLNFARLHAGIFEYNVSSMQVLEKNGYVKEGIFRKAIFKQQQLWDEHRYAILS